MPRPLTQGRRLARATPQWSHPLFGGPRLAGLGADHVLVEYLQRPIASDGDDLVRMRAILSAAPVVAIGPQIEAEVEPYVAACMNAAGIAWSRQTFAE